MGSIELEINGKITLIQQDDFTVINMDQVHRFYGNQSNLVLILYIERNLLLNECSSLNNYNINCVNNTDYHCNELKYILRKMLMLVIEKKYGYELKFKSLLFEFIHNLYVNFQAEKNNAIINMDTSADMKIDLAIQYIRKNYHKQISLKEIAGEVYMSPYYFSKYFKQKMGIGFLQFLHKVRIENAINSLLYSDDSILQVAINNGFPNSDTFIQVFKRIYNETPNVYRKKIKQASNTDNKLPFIFDLVSSNNIQEFFRYIKKYEMNTIQLTDESYQIEMKRSINTDFIYPDNILNIYDIATVLREDFVNILGDLKDRLKIKYIYFVLDYAYTGSSKPAISRHEVFHSINFIRRNGFIPSFRIVPIHSNSDIEDKETILTLTKIFEPMIEAFEERFDLDYTSLWKFEIFTNEIPVETAITFYKTAYTIIKRHMTLSQIGIFAISDNRPESLDRYTKLLQDIVKVHKPDFLTFEAFPNKIKKFDITENYYYNNNMKGYHKDILGSVLNICKKTILNHLPVIMTDWNTLSADNILKQKFIIVRL